MKQTKSNSLQRALVTGDVGPHPDAEMLTAFAEDTLLPCERENVLAHVARCAECREVLSLAGTVAGPQAVLSPATGRKWTGWHIGGPLLVAAAMIAIVSTLVLRYVGYRPAQNVTVAKNPEVQSEHPPPPTISSPAAAPQPPDLTASAPKKERREIRKQAPAETAPMFAAPIPGTSATEANAPLVPAAGSSADTTSETQLARVPAAKAASPQTRLALQAPAQASAFANTVTSHALASAPVASIARPHWRINEQGQPERAFGDGAWQPVLPNGSAKMHTLTVYGGEVWVGGEDAQVFRSVDNGTSWRVVVLPEKSGSDHTIAHIRFSSAQEIAIEASDGTAWTTTDGGASWK